MANAYEISQRRAAFMTAQTRQAYRDLVRGTVQDLDAGEISAAEAQEILDAATVCTWATHEKPALKKLIDLVGRDLEQAFWCASENWPEASESVVSDSPEHPTIVAPLTTAPEILMLDPAGLSPHPLLERMTMLSDLAGQLRARAKKAGHNRKDMIESADEADANFAALCASVASQGVLEPLLVAMDDAGDYRIIDGRHRWRAALNNGIAAVPCLVRAEADAGQIIADAVTGRRHFSKGAIAWIAVITHPEIATEAKAGKPKANYAAAAQLAQGSQESLAVRHGVSLRLVVDACRLYRILEQYPSLRDDYEMQVWAGKELGALAGQAQAEVEGKKAVAPELQSMQHKLKSIFAVSLAEMSTRFERRWAECDETTRHATKLAAEAFATKAPEEVRAAMLAVWKEEA